MIEQVYDKANNTGFLLEELKKGNERAFSFLFRQYYKPLCRFSYSIVREQAAAESIVQDIFVKLWAKRGDLGELKSLQSYLMGMVKNQSIDFLRKKRAEEKKYLHLKITGAGNTTDEQVSVNEFEEKLQESILKLPGRCREAIEMSRFDGLSNKEIAQQMQISVKGVEALIGRSLKILRTELREFLPSFSYGKPGKGTTMLLSFFLSKFSKSM